MVSSEESTSSSSQENQESSEEEVDSPDQTKEQPAAKKVRKPRCSTKWPLDKLTVTGIGGNGEPTERKGKLRLRMLAGLPASPSHRQQRGVPLPQSNHLSLCDGVMSKNNLNCRCNIFMMSTEVFCDA